MAIKQVICHNGHDKRLTGEDKRGRCRVCKRYYLREWQNKNRWKYKDKPYTKRKPRWEVARKSSWKSRGVKNENGSFFSPLDYDRLYQIQQGKCAICGKHQTELKQRLNVDHNHTTGIVRALLCRMCNGLFLPMFEREEKAEMYISYLKRTNSLPAFWRG